MTVAKEANFYEGIISILGTYPQNGNIPPTP